MDVSNTITKVIESSNHLNGTFNEGAVLAYKLGQATKNYSKEAVEAAIVQSTLSSENIRAILFQQGYTDELLESTTAKLAEITTTNSLAKSQSATTTSTLGLGTAFKGLGLSIKNTTTAMWTFLTTTPLGWITMAVSAIALVVAGYNAWNTSLEEQKEKLEESEEAFKNAKSELEGIKNEIESTQDRIEELNKIPNPSFVEQAELERLREVNDELERQKMLKQDEQLAATEELYDENKKTYEKEFESSYGTTSVSDTKDALSSGKLTVGQLYESDNITDIIASLQYLNEEKKKLTDPSEIERYDELIAEMTDRVKSNGSDFLSSISQYKQNILSIAGTRELTENEQLLYDSLSSMQKAIYEFYDSATWNTLEFESIFDTKGIEVTKEELIEMAKAGTLNEETIRGYNKLSEAIGNSEFILGDGTNAFQAFINEIMSSVDAIETFSGTIEDIPTILSVTETVDQIDKQLKPALDSLGEAYRTIFEDTFNLENVDTVGIAKDLKDEFDELAELGININTDAYEDFVNVLSNTSSTADDVKTAFNELATAITDVSISGIEDFDVLKKSLSDLGVVNNVEVAFASLARNKEALFATGLDLSTATQQEISDFAAEYVSAENLSQAIQYLTYQKMLNAMTDMDTTEEVSNLLVLAKNAGITGEAISYLTELEILYQEISSGTLNADMMAEYQARADELVSLIKSSATEFKPKVKFTPTIDTKDLDKKAEDATKAAKEALEATLELYKTELDAGIIDLATYLKKCNDLLNDARDKAIITGKEYWDYQKEVTENQKDIYDKVLSAISRRYDKEIDSIEKVIDSIEKQNDALEKQKSIMDGVINAIIRILDREIESIDDIIDGIEKQNEALEEQQDKYDSALSAISKYLEKQKELVQANIDGVEKENDVIQDEIDGYDKLLNAVTLVMDAKREAIEADKQGIQDRIDALRDENDEAKKAYELEQAKLDLERLRNQRNKKLYVEGQGYIYDVDHKAIREQEDNVADLELDATISALEKEQELLDDILEQLDATEQKWQDIASVFKNNKALDKAKELLGDNFQNIIIEGDESSINDILNSYINAQEKLEENALVIEDYEKRIEELEAIAEKWESAANIKQETENAINASELLGKQWQEDILADKQSTYENFCDNYLAIQSKIEDNTTLIESYNQKVEYYENLKEQWQDITDAYTVAQEDLSLVQMLGANAEADILSGRLDVLENFKSEYLNIQAQIEDNSLLIESYEEKVEYYENLKQQWADIADAYKNAEEDMYLTQVLGTNAEADLLSGRLDVLEDFKSKYAEIEQALVDIAWNSANEQNKALASVGNGDTNGSGKVDLGSGADVPVNQESKNRTVYEVIDANGESFGSYNSHAEADDVAKHLVDSGEAEAPTKIGEIELPKFHDGIKKGYPDTSMPKDKKAEILEKLATKEISLDSDEVPVIARKNELFLNASQQNMLVANYQKFMESRGTIPWNVPIVNTNPLGNIGMTERGQNVSVSIGDIHLHEVQNVDSFANAIVRQLPNKVLQAVHRR